MLPQPIFVQQYQELYQALGYRHGNMLARTLFHSVRRLLHRLPCFDFVKCSGAAGGAEQLHKVFYTKTDASTTCWH